MATAVVPEFSRTTSMAKWVESVSARAFENRNPANTDELVGMFPASTAEDVGRGRGRRPRSLRMRGGLVPAPKRAEILYRAAETLVRRKEDLARDMTRGNGQEWSWRDARRRAGSHRHDLLHGRRRAAAVRADDAVGIAATSLPCRCGSRWACARMITPWNFPMAIPSWKIMPALVCGNTVVIKPAEDTPLSTYNLAQILTEAGLPRGVVNVVNGMGPEAGAPLVRHPGVAAVSFTGSSEVGRLVSEACAPKLRPCHLEMGGKNILIVMEDANLDLAVEGAVWAGFGTTGQRCTAASRVAVHKKVYNEFLEKIRGAGEGAARGRRPRSGDARWGRASTRSSSKR